MARYKFLLALIGMDGRADGGGYMVPCLCCRLECYFFLICIPRLSFLILVGLFVGRVVLLCGVPLGVLLLCLNCWWAP